MHLLPRTNFHLFNFVKHPQAAIEKNIYVFAYYGKFGSVDEVPYKQKMDWNPRYKNQFFSIGSVFIPQ